MLTILLAVAAAVAMVATPLGAGAMVKVAEAELAALPGLASIPILDRGEQAASGQMLSRAGKVAAQAADSHARAAAALKAGDFLGAAKFARRAATSGQAAVTIATAVRTMLIPKVEK